MGPCEGHGCLFVRRRAQTLPVAAGCSPSVARRGRTPRREELCLSSVVAHAAPRRSQDSRLVGGLPKARRQGSGFRLQPLLTAAAHGYSWTKSARCYKITACASATAFGHDVATTVLQSSRNKQQSSSRDARRDEAAITLIRSADARAAPHREHPNTAPEDGAGAPSSSTQFRIVEERMHARLPALIILVRCRWGKRHGRRRA